MSLPKMKTAVKGSPSMLKTKPSQTGKPIRRRTFLNRVTTGVSAAFVAPLIVPARVLGGNGKVAPGSRITIGMIGTGRQATYANIPGFLQEADAQIVAVCDVDSRRMETRASLSKLTTPRSRHPARTRAARRSAISVSH